MRRNYIVATPIGTRLFFMFLANIPADAPPQHVHIVVAATPTFGCYPIGADLHRIEFQPPRRASFAEFAARLASDGPRRKRNREGPYRGLNPKARNLLHGRLYLKFPASPTMKRV